jgi:hypothetical protein
MTKSEDLFNLVIESFIKNGFELYDRNSFIATLRRWKLVHKTEDLKIIETSVNIILTEENEPQILVRYSYYEK